ncbi:MAG: NUDIX domain-containing protein [Anaerolineales bacterium]|nr:NUDIX domain-containing protein [Anaerolineales bacterium]
MPQSTFHYAAAGGLVLRGAELLLLHKHYKNEYVLPKGHVEPGETLEQTALRETREETGYVNLRLLDNLGTRRAEFPLNGRWITRDETYYLMTLVDERRDEAQAHGDADHDRRIFRRLWVPLGEAADRLTYEPAKTFARDAAAWVQAHGLPTMPE